MRSDTFPFVTGTDRSPPLLTSLKFLSQLLRSYSKRSVGTQNTRGAACFFVRCDLKEKAGNAERMFSAVTGRI
jgi:hypothetical protein